MSVKIVTELGILFKDARATREERKIMLAALNRSPELTDISARARLTLQNLRQRKEANRPKTGRRTR